MLWLTILCVMQNFFSHFGTMAWPKFKVSHCPICGCTADNRYLHDIDLCSERLSFFFFLGKRMEFSKVLLSLTENKEKYYGSWIAL